MPSPSCSLPVCLSFLYPTRHDPCQFLHAMSVDYVLPRANYIDIHCYSTRFRCLGFTEMNSHQIRPCLQVVERLQLQDTVHVIPVGPAHSVLPVTRCFSAASHAKILNQTEETFADDRT